MNDAMLRYEHPMLLKVTPTRNRPGDAQFVYRFRNGYGASVVQNGTSYTADGRLWELAVIRFENAADNSWDICYETPITNDVIGYLDPEDVITYLNRVGDLPPDAQALPGAQLDFPVHNDSP